MFRVIIAGSRNFNDYELLKIVCNQLLSYIYDEIEIVSGEARGADELGEKYAMDKKFRLKTFPADWNRYGKKAGYLRNREMAIYADALICFWDGKSKGSEHMIDLAKEYDLKIHIEKYNGENKNE